MPIEIELDTSDVRALAKKIKSARIDDEAKARMSILAGFVLGKLRTEAPFKTGRLVLGLTTKEEGPGEWVFYETGTIEKRPTGTVNYGPIVRRGTGKKNYPIFPKVKKALWWPGLLRPISHVVSHPGIDPNPYHERAMEGSQKMISYTAAAIGADIVSLITR